MPLSGLRHPDAWQQLKNRLLKISMACVRYAKSYDHDEVLVSQVETKATVLGCLPHTFPSCTAVYLVVSAQPT